MVNAVRGTLDTLARYVTDRRPRHLAFTTDEDWRPDWRVELIPGYKEHRTAEPIPPALIPQVPIILASLEAVGIDVVGLEGYEAEDIVASLAAKVKPPIEIASGDRDLFSQVQGTEVIVLYPQKGGVAVVDEAEVARRYGIPGRAYADYAILRGDPSDGLPGVRGIGEKTASQLLAKYGSLDGVLAAKDLSPTIRAKLNASKEYVVAARTVVGPVLDCDIEVTGDGTIPKAPPEPMHVAALAQRYGVEASVRRVVDALKA